MVLTPSRSFTKQSVWNSKPGPNSWQPKMYQITISIMRRILTKALYRMKLNLLLLWVSHCFLACRTLIVLIIRFHYHWSEHVCKPPLRTYHFSNALLYLAYSFVDTKLMLFFFVFNFMLVILFNKRGCVNFVHYYARFGIVMTLSVI